MTAPQQPAELVRSYYRSYETDDRALAERLLASTFTFSSPVDDNIDRSTFFGKCWPYHRRLRTFHLRQLAVDGAHALVRYEAEEHDGTTFCNVEHLELAGGRITHIDVYFGAVPGVEASTPSA